MIGSSKYGFTGGIVTVTQIDPEAFAPSDAELAEVKDAMQAMLSGQRQPDLTFTVNGAMYVKVETHSRAAPIDIIRAAIKPLLENKRIHK